PLPPEQPVPEVAEAAAVRRRPFAQQLGFRRRFELRVEPETQAPEAELAAIGQAVTVIARFHHIAAVLAGLQTPVQLAHGEPAEYRARAGFERRLNGAMLVEAGILLPRHRPVVEG